MSQGLDVLKCHLNSDNFDQNLGTLIGVESNWKSFKIRSIRFENLRFDWLKGQKIFEIFDENLFEIRSIRFDSNYRVESNFSDARFVRNSFDSIIYDSIDSKVKNNSKNSIKINSKFVRFDSTPPLVFHNSCFKSMRP